LTTAPYAAIGLVNLSGSGSFSMTETVFSNNSTQRYQSGGTYTVSSDCNLTLNFNQTPAGTATGGSDGSTGGSGQATFVAPVSFQGILVNDGLGLLSLQPDKTNTVTGQFFPQ